MNIVSSLVERVLGVMICDKDDGDLRGYIGTTEGGGNISLLSFFLI